MPVQKFLSRVHRALGWMMLFLLPMQFLLGLWGIGKVGGRESWLAASVHVSPATFIVLGLMVITHGLLGIRFSVIKKMGARSGATVLIILWAVLVGMMAFLIIH